MCHSAWLVWNSWVGSFAAALWGQLAGFQRFGSHASSESKRWRGLLTARSCEVSTQFRHPDERCSPAFKRKQNVSFVIVAVSQNCRMEMNMDVWNPSLPSLTLSTVAIHLTRFFKDAIIMCSPSCCYFRSWVWHWVASKAEGWYPFPCLCGCDSKTVAALVGGASAKAASALSTQTSAS